MPCAFYCALDGMDSEKQRFFCLKIMSTDKKKAPPWERALHRTMLICSWVCGKKDLYILPKSLLKIRIHDDVVVIFSGCAKEPLDFHPYLNATNDNLRLNLVYIHCLVLNITKDTGCLHTVLKSMENVFDKEVTIWQYSNKHGRVQSLWRDDILCNQQKSFSGSNMVLMKMLTFLNFCNFATLSIYFWCNQYLVCICYFVI